MIKVSINRKSATGEYLVMPSEDGRMLPQSAYYTSDPQDAVDTAITIIEQHRRRNQEAELSQATYTLRIVNKYDPGWLMIEARRVFQKVGKV